jgi:hypothetical protein
MILGADRRLPWLDAAAGPEDVHVEFLGAPPQPEEGFERIYVSSSTDHSGAPAFDVLRSQDRFRFRYRDGTQLTVGDAGRAIEAWAPETATVADTCSYLFGPVMGWVLRLRGGVPLHASAVAMGGRAVAFLGPAGAGKSTLAAALVLDGAELVSDDLVPTLDGDGRIRIAPAYPCVRLWPESVAMLYGDGEALPRLSPSWDKRGLEVRRHGLRFREQAVDLAAVYVLEGPAPSPASATIAPLTGHRALVTLIANTYVSYLLTDDMRRRELAVLGRLLAGVPVRRVQASGLDTLCEAIVADLAAGPAPGGCTHV